MKKYVLSAVVTSLFVPLAYAMDGGAAPAVEVEVPAVETPAVDEVAVEVGEVPVEVTTLEVEVVIEEPKPEVCLDVAEGVPFDPDTQPKEYAAWVAEQPVLELSVDCPVATDHIPDLWMRRDLVIEVDPLTFFVEGEALGLYLIDQTIDGEAVDPNLVDLASQSGLPVDENGKTAETEVIDLSFQDGVSNSVDADGNPVILYFATASTGELPQSAPAGGSGEVEVTAIEDSPVRSLHGDIQPNFRSGTTDQGAEALAAFSGGVVAEAPAEAQLLNDEQRSAVRGLRSDAEPVKPRSGMSKLLSKFRKPKAEVIQASASATTDTVLSSKLAEVDRLRDTALRTGDQKMLAKADKLEQELRTKAGQVTKIPTRAK